MADVDITAARLQLQELQARCQGLADAKLALALFLQDASSLQLQPRADSEDTFITDAWQEEEESSLQQQMNNLAALISSYEDQQAALCMLDQEEASQAASLQLASALSAQEAWDANVLRPHDAALARAIAQASEEEWQQEGGLLQDPLDLTDRPQDPVGAVTQTSRADVGASISSFPCPTSAQRASASTSKVHAADHQAHVGQGPQQLCNICFDSFPISKMMAARLPPQQACSSSAAGRCGHLFCCGCMREYVKCEVQARKHPISCPDPSCPEELEVEDVMQLLVQDTRELQIYESVVAEQLIGADRCVYCPYKDCSALLERPDPEGEEGQADGQEAPFECPRCHRTFCISCGITGWHHGFTCQQFQALPPELRSAEDAAVLQVAQQKQWKRCPAPGCGHLVERTEGCNHMRCRCGNDFCYACGSLYRSTKPTANNVHGSPACSCPLFPVPDEEPERRPVVLRQVDAQGRPWRAGRRLRRARCRHSASIYDCPYGPERCWFWHDEDDDMDYDG